MYVKNDYIVSEYHICPMKHLSTFMVAINPGIILILTIEWYKNRRVITTNARILDAYTNRFFTCFNHVRCFDVIGATAQ